MTPIDFENQLIKHEGLKTELYKCPAGKWTIGIGRNLEDNGITESEARFLLQNDITRHASELLKAFPVVNSLNPARYYCLLNMAFNMGIVRLSGFKKMWAAIEEHNYDAAALEMLDSAWANQVGNRAVELSFQMKTGKYIR